MSGNYQIWLENLCWKQINELFENPSDTLKERLRQELGIIKDRNLGFFFWMINILLGDLVKERVPYSTRGSSGDSLVLHLLGLTHYNPLDNALPAVFFYGQEYEKKQLSFDINLYEDDRERVLQKLLEETSHIETGFDEAKRSLILEIIFQTGTLEGNEVSAGMQEKTGDEHDRKYVIKVHSRSWKPEENTGFVIRIYRNSDIDLLHELKDITGEAAPQNPETEEKLFDYFDLANGQRYDPSGLSTIDSTFIRNYCLNIVHPRTCIELSKLLGLTVASDAYIGNQQPLLEDKIITLGEAISSREDVYNYLISYGFDEDQAYSLVFDIINRDRSISVEDIKAMADHGVPELFVNIIKKTGYLFCSGQMFDYTWQILALANYKHNHTKEFEALIKRHRGRR